MIELIVQILGIMWVVGCTSTALYFFIEYLILKYKNPKI
jgi:beta-lactamase regulating signal transducer with metallopeptidase domain